MSLTLSGKTKEVTLKLLIGSGLLVCISAAIYFIIQAPSDSQTALIEVHSKSSTPSSSDEKQTQQTTELTINPFPIEAFTDEQCRDIEWDYDNSFFRRSDSALESATQAYLAGESKEDVADAIWLTTGPTGSENWYVEMSIYEATKQHQAAIAELNLSTDIIEKLRAFQNEIESGRFQEFRVSQLFTHINVKPINRAITERLPLDDVLSTVDDAIGHLPIQLLEDPHLSPVRGLIKSSLELQFYELSIALMERYPSLLKQDSKYQNAFISTLLSVLHDSISSESNSNQLKRIAALLQKDNTTIVIKVLPSLIGPAYAEAVAIELIELGIPLRFAKFFDLTPKSVSIDLLGATPAYDALLEKYKQCRAPENWVKSRRHSKEEWQSFASTPFTKKAMDSFEFKICNVEKNFSDFVGDYSKVKEAVRDIQMYLATEEISLLDVLPNELPIPELTNDERAVVIGLIANGYLQYSDYSDEKVKKLMDDANLFPQPTSMEAKQALLSMQSATLWHDSLDFSDNSKNYMLLNMLAFEGKFAVFEALLDKIDVDDEQMYDPLYFFLEGYSSLRSVGGNAYTSDNTDNKRFANYFIENGYEFLPHHQRVTLEKKITAMHQLEELEALFPQLKIADTEDFFAVTCK